jgi:anti-sigma B factor antagonist
VLFDIQTEELDTPGTAVVRVVGELDVATAPRLRQEAVRLVGLGITRVVLDLGGVDFIDSTGLGVIVGMVKRLRTHGGELSLIRGEDRVTKVFDITRVSDILPLHESLDEALAALPIADSSAGGE